MPTNIYDVPVRVSGRLMLHIEAGSQDAAMAQAHNITAEYDFGSLEDIDWEVRPPVSVTEKEITAADRIATKMRIHKPDGLHGWGIEYNYDPQDAIDGDASEFIFAACPLLLNKPGARWFWQSGCNSKKRGYQFFEYMGPDAEKEAKRAMTEIRDALSKT